MRWDMALQLFAVPRLIRYEIGKHLLLHLPWEAER